MLRSVRRGGGEGGGGGGPFQPSQKFTRQLSLFMDVGKEEEDEEERALFDSFIFCHAGKKNTKKNTRKKKYAREVHQESFVGGCPSAS